MGVRVSIIIPCFNVEAFVERAIASALQQTYQNVEIICVDNNSTDSTRLILQKYAKEYPTEIQVFSATQQGAPAARNLGLLYATGEWIQFLDADDEILPDKLERQLGSLESGMTLVIGTPEYVDIDGHTTIFPIWPEIWLGLAHGMHAGNTVANLYRKDVLRLIGGWKENLPFLQDLHLLFELLQRQAVIQTDQIPSCRCYDRPSGKITQQDPAGMYEAAIHFNHTINSWLQENAAVYWQCHESSFYTALLRRIKLLAKYDINQAMLLAKQYLPQDFVPPRENEFSVGLWHQLAYPLLGLERSERLKRWLIS